MYLLNVRNVQEALPEGLALIEAEGVLRDSRNGQVLQLPAPLTTAYEKSNERVVFWASRDANPFFHLMEALWMLAGRRDVAFVEQFVPRMRNFSDDGETFHGAYGYRWRNYFNKDQIVTAFHRLLENPDDRRQVIGMWDSAGDMGVISKDIPCNLSVTVQINTEGAVDILVNNRSNDMIWGAYGANAVHFSMLHELFAAGLNRPLGTYYQVSMNTHVYTEVLTPELQALSDRRANLMVPRDMAQSLCPYRSGQVTPYPLLGYLPKSPYPAAVQLMKDCEMFVDNPTMLAPGMSPFIRYVAHPAYKAWAAFKNKENPNRFEEAIELVTEVKAQDWRLAMYQWLKRREERAAKAGA